MYEGYVQNVDYLNDSLKQNMVAALNHYENQWTKINQRLYLNTPLNRIKQNEQVVLNLQTRLSRAIQAVFTTKSTQLQHSITSLDYLSPLKIMGRGYSYVTKQDRVVKQVSELQIDTEIELHLSDGTAQAKITDIKDGGLKND